ncbi:MAG TPA: nuclear transport factor 2 family protein [Alphaproteobacteria bacterium]|nr:nuclear transport factor 2 family protein [Alphaproteobacteria bacterium]
MAQSASTPARTSREVLDDHLHLRQIDNIEADLARNYAPDVIVLTSDGPRHGADGVRALHEQLRRTVPHDYEIVTKEIAGRFAFITWRAREPGKSVEDGTDSFVIENGRIVFQSIHYSVQEVMPG